jgi:hypothetical protein
MLYQFNELSDKAKEKAISCLSDITVCGDWWDSEYEDAANVGILITSFDLDRNRHACATIDSPLFTAQEIISQHGDCCNTYKTAKTFYDKINPKVCRFEDLEDCDELTEEMQNEYDELKEEFKKDITEDYSIILQRQYEFLCSEEAIIETIEANEYEFTEDGEPA